MTPDSHEIMIERTCRLVTLGCKVNQYETQLVREALLKNGFREAAEDEPADLCVVNTCTVTGEADSKGRQLIRRLARQNPGTRTIVMGCYATREPEVLKDLPSVFEIVIDLGDRKHCIPRALRTYENFKKLTTREPA